MNVVTEPTLASQDGQTRVRTLFLSDLHLGTKGCQAEKLLEFLRDYSADVIYLVGDIVDGWMLRSGWYWPQTHNDVVQKLLRQARKGARMSTSRAITTSFFATFTARISAASRWSKNTIHVTADGRRFLVIHGDLFDVVIRHARWLALLGNKAYDLAISLNTWFNAARRLLGLPYWSLSQWVKLKVKNAVNFIGEYERTLDRRGSRHQRRWGDLWPHPPCGDPAGRQDSPTSTAATGSKAAPPSSSISTGALKSSTGPTASRAMENSSSAAASAATRCHSGVIESSYDLKSCDLRGR